MSSKIGKMMKAVRKQLKLIIKLPNGVYVNRSNAYDELINIIPLAPDFDELYLSRCCSVIDDCYRRKWFSRNQYEYAYETINWVNQMMISNSVY